MSDVYVSQIHNTNQLQAQINAALADVYDGLDKAGTVTKVSTGTGLTGGPITSTGTISMADTAVTAGDYTSADITVDKQGRITKAASGSAGTVTKVDTGAGLSGGPITATGTVTLDVGYANTWTARQTFDRPNTPGVAFASLPATPTSGDRAMVTDASATTFASVVAGGGANIVPVFFDGTDWRIG